MTASLLLGLAPMLQGQTTGLTLTCWGDDGFGQCDIPSGLTNPTQASAGFGYSLALGSDGTVTGWGNQPAAIPTGLSNVTAIASGVIFSLALKNDGTVVAWGDDTYGQCEVPAGLSNVVAIAAGTEHSIALKNDGTVVAWGFDSDGQTEPPAGLSNVVAVAGGNYHTLALQADGTVLSWGGDGGGISLTSTGLSNVVAVACEYYASLALTADGTVYLWSEATPVNAATPVDGFTNIIAMAAFYDHFLALGSDGTILDSGSDPFGTTTVPSTLKNVVGIATGGGHGMALMGNGNTYIVQQPVPRILMSGFDAAFSVGVAGTGPLTYQWQWGTTNLPGATNNCLVISDVQTTNDGQYQVVVTGPANAVTSTSATLTVLPTPPTITLQPAAQLGWQGNSASFTAAAAGSLPLYFQWQFNGTNVDGATNSLLNLTNLTTADQGNYSVVVSNAVGIAVSSNAWLTIGGLAEALNTTNLVWQTAGDLPWLVDPSNWAYDGVAAAVASAPNPGDEAILQTTATGPATLTFWWEVISPVYGFNYTLTVNGMVQPFASPGLRWQQQTCYLGAGTNLLQWVYANDSAYVVPDVSAWLDEVSLVPGGTGPMITTSPGNQTQPAGTNVTFTVGASGTPPLDYQWFQNGVLLAGATNASFTFYLLTTNQGGGYSVLVTNNYGSATSSVASLTVQLIPPGIAQQPATQIVRAGATAVLGVTPSGSPPFSYQWYFNGAALSGQTNSILSLPGVATNQTGAYLVAVSSPYGSVTSQVATLTVGWYPIITAQPTNQAWLAGSRVLLSAGVSGIGPFTFQWQYNGTNLPGTVVTLAGNGTNGYAGDGGLATTGKISVVQSMAMDAGGNLLIDDAGTWNSGLLAQDFRIRRVDANGIITTAAGTNAAGFSGDGGPAIYARINTSAGLAADASGNFYLADTGNSRIRRVDTSGIITRLAGNSTQGGFGGDTGAATNALLWRPAGLTLDLAGNLFIADAENNRIRKVDTNGTITTVAGSSTAGFAGDGGLATNASLNYPIAVAVDTLGNLFISDQGNDRIRKVDGNGIISTIAGNGTTTLSAEGVAATNTGFSLPCGMALDNYGDLFVADSGHGRIRRVDPYGIITTVAGTNASLNPFNGDGMNPTNTAFNNPNDVILDPYGRMVVADTLNFRVRRFGQGPVLALNNLGTTNAGAYQLLISSSFGTVTSSVATVTALYPPAMVNQPASQTAGLGSNATIIATASGTAPLAWQWQINGANLPGQTNPALTLTNLQWTDTGIYSVIVTNNYGSVTSSPAALTVVWPPVITSQPAGLTVLAGGSAVFNVGVTGTGPFSYQWQLNGTNLPDGIIATVAGTGTAGYAGDGGPATNATLRPFSLALDAGGNLYVAESANAVIRRVDTNGIVTTVAGTGTAGFSGDGGLATAATLKNPFSVAVDAAGNLLIADGYNERVRKVDLTGRISTVAGTGAYGFAGDGSQATNASLYNPWSVTVDRGGNILFSDEYNYRIRKINTGGIITTVAGGGTNDPGKGVAATTARLYAPLGVTTDSSGNLYFADNTYHRIYRVNTNGMVAAFAGSGTNGYAGDGGAATNANLGTLAGIAADNLGNLFLTDGYRLRRVDGNGIITTVAGNGMFGYAGDGGPATNAALRSPGGVAVDASDNLFLADNGSYRVRKVTNTRLANLVLNNISPAYAGTYQVTVSAAGGVLASRSVTLNVITQPLLTAPPSFDASGNVTLNLSTTPNFTSRLFVTTNLSPPVVWQPVYTNPLGGAWQFTDTNAPGQPQQFYRITTP